MFTRPGIFTNKLSDVSPFSARDPNLVSIISQDRKGHGLHVVDEKHPGHRHGSIWVNGSRRQACWIAWVGCVPIWKSNKRWNSFLTCPKLISSFSSTHEFCFSLCILSKHMLKGSKARPKSQSWTSPTDRNWIDWDWDEFPGETSYQKNFLFLECNPRASPEVKVSGVTCWYELCGKLGF